MTQFAQVTAKKTLLGLVFEQACSPFVTYAQSWGSGGCDRPSMLSFLPSLPLGSQSSSSLGPSAYLLHRVQGLQGTQYLYKGTQLGEGEGSLLLGQGAGESSYLRRLERGKVDWSVSQRS